MNRSHLLRAGLSAVLMAAVAAGAAAPALAVNPCAPKAANPCAPKAMNPCAARPEIDPARVTRPAGTRLFDAPHAELVKEGEALFKDASLSTNGMSCNSCHEGNSGFMPSFAEPFPHTVAMAKERAGKRTIELDEMVQVCMIAPMAAEPLPWESRELAALTAYTAEMQKAFQAQSGAESGKAANPCAPRNPCAPMRK